MNIRDLVVTGGFEIDNRFETSKLVLGKDSISTFHLFNILFKCYPSTAEFRISVDKQEEIVKILKEKGLSILAIDMDMKYDMKNFFALFIHKKDNYLVELSSTFDDTHKTPEEQAETSATMPFLERLVGTEDFDQTRKINLTVSFDLGMPKGGMFSKLLEDTFKESKKEQDDKVHIFEKDEYGDMGLNAYKIDGYDVDLETHYNDDFVDLDKKLKTWVKDFANINQKLTLLNGPPGGGKTNYIKHLMKTTPGVRKIYIPPYFVSAIADPAFFGFIKKYSKSLLIIEDAEKILLSRESAEENPAISVLLNLTDGILAQILNFKIICTFNSDENNIDDALKRPGRLFQNYKFGALNKTKTYNLFKAIHGTEPPKAEMTLAEIYNTKSNGAKKKEEPRSIGFGG